MDPHPLSRSSSSKGIRFRQGTVIAAMALLFLGCAGKESRWWQGNLHTHSLWSDGDDYPEMIIDWYKSHGYHFLALSDHNILSDHEKWIDLAEGKGTKAQRAIQAYDAYEARFGADWVDVRTGDANKQVRLKTLAEIKPLFTEANRFVLIQSEEISDRFESKPIHVNATNIVEHIAPQGGQSVLEVMQNNIDAVLEQGERTGQSILPHINHPNYGWAITAEDLIALQGDNFFEVYNGHPAVHNYGDSLRSGMEMVWDIVLSARLTQGQSILFGIAVDDAHNYHDYDLDHSNPGRAWIMVRSPALDPESLIEAMVAGDFYASTGVALSGYQAHEDRIEIEISEQAGISYKTQFIGTRRAGGEEVANRDGEPIGVLLGEVAGPSATYHFAGDELYVRAKIMSSKLKDNPYRNGEFEVAWTQPVRPGSSHQ